MSQELISRQAAIDAFMMATADGDKAEWCEYVIRQVPSAEPERKTGKWIIFPPCFEEICMCSNCKTKFFYAYQHRDICPNCGAWMEVSDVRRPDEEDEI